MSKQRVIVGCPSGVGYKGQDMSTCADLEIGLHRREGSGYAVELRLTWPRAQDQDEVDIRGAGTGVQIDLDDLQALALDPEAYGKRLSENLFADQGLRKVLDQALATTQRQEIPLRLRLFVGPSAPELHSLYWEALQDPENGRSLLTGENLLFSRYLSSLDWRPVRLRPQSELKALVLIADPSNLTSYGLASLDRASELKRVRASLCGIPVTDLASQGHATLSELGNHLRSGYDIVYLLAHGTLKDGEPWLWLEEDDGTACRVAGRELVALMRELRQQPRLVVLASCQSSGGGGAWDVLAALGPLLAQAGIPAVLCMHGCVSMETVAQFMPTFFEELKRDGQIDRAIAVARGTVRKRSDAWMPVLFMRLHGGRIWSVPGFAGGREGFPRMPALVGHIQRGRCTPVLGPGLLEPMIGSNREVAERLAKAYDFPMEPSARDQLPQVAQYLRFYYDEAFPRDRLEDDLRRRILKQCDEVGIPELPDDSLDALIAALGRRLQEAGCEDAHLALARLQCPLYVTTNPDSLLEEALRAQGVRPEMEVCPWNDYAEQRPSIFHREPDYLPRPGRPLVYHLFGHLREPDSMVLTEDDYFDHLIGATRNKDLIPSAVRMALTNTALLFLGFQVDDWSFRVLLRSLMSQEGRRRRRHYAHVAVQIDPEGGRLLDPERARRFLESYFQGADISIYWGSVQDFINELLGAWNEAKG